MLFDCFVQTQSKYNSLACHYSLSLFVFNLEHYLHYFIIAVTCISRMYGIFSMECSGVTNLTADLGVCEQFLISVLSVYVAVFPLKLFLFNFFRVLQDRRDPLDHRVSLDHRENQAYPDCPVHLDRR